MLIRSFRSRTDTELRDVSFRKDHRGLLEERRFATRVSRRLAFHNIRAHRRADGRYPRFHGGSLAGVPPAGGVLDTAVPVGGPSGRRRDLQTDFRIAEGRSTGEDLSERAEGGGLASDVSRADQGRKRTLAERHRRDGDVDPRQDHPSAFRVNRVHIGESADARRDHGGERIGRGSRRVSKIARQAQIDRLQHVLRSVRAGIQRSLESVAAKRGADSRQRAAAVLAAALGVPRIRRVRQLLPKPYPELHSIDISGQDNFQIEERHRASFHDSAEQCGRV